MMFNIPRSSANLNVFALFNLRRGAWIVNTSSSASQIAVSAELTNLSRQSGYPAESASHTPVTMSRIPCCAPHAAASVKNSRLRPGTKVEGNPCSTAHLFVSSWLFVRSVATASTSIREFVSAAADRIESASTGIK